MSINGVLLYISEMMDFSLTHAGVYREYQPEYRQVIGCSWISLHVRGILRIKYLDGSLALERPGAFLSLGIPGTPIYFETGRVRENYVLMVEGLSLRHGAELGMVEVAYRGQWVTVPIYIPLDVMDLPVVLDEFRMVLDLFHHPLPANQLKTELMVGAILRRFLERADSEKAHTPGEKLRLLIEQDKTFRRSLPELSEQCGYTADHLRVLFRRQFGISPQEYRSKRRMSAIMDLITHTQLSAKEIAMKTGFEYLSHFSAFFKEHAGMTTREAIGKLRITPSLFFATDRHR